jgi:polygalacturonase
LLLILATVHANIVKYIGVPSDSSLEVAWKNGALLNQTLNSLRPGDELVFAENTTYYLVGGIIAADLSDIVIHIDGSLIFTDNTETWPRTASGQVLECLHFDTVRNVTFTSQTIGLLDGQGETWWGLAGYYEYLENRPRLLSMANSANILIENILFKNSPYWTVWIYGVDGLEIRNSEVSNRRNDYDGHDFYNLW